MKLIELKHRGNFNMDISDAEDWNCSGSRYLSLSHFKGKANCKNELKSGLMVYVCNSQLNERLKQNHFKLKGSPCHRVKSSPE